MGWTFRMVFEGVCAFATDEPLFVKDKSGQWVANGEKPKRLTVLIPNLQQPALAQGSTLDKPLFRAAHFPLLMFEREDFAQGSTRFIDLSLQDPASTVEKGVCVLQGDSIGLDEAPGRRLSFDTERAAQSLPAPADRSSLWWLPNLAEIAPDAGDFDPKLKPETGKPLDSRLAASLSVEAGRVFSLDFNFPDDGAAEPTVWEFSTDQPGTGSVWNRAVANRIALEITDLTAPFGLTFERVDSSVVMSSRALFSPPPGSRKKVVEVHVANVELEKLFSETDLFPNAGRSFADADFEAFYSLTKSSSAVRPVPRVRKVLEALGPIKQPCAPSHGKI